MIQRVARTYRAAFSGLPRDVWLLCAILLINRSGTMVLPFLALYLTVEQGLSIGWAGRVLSLFGLGSILGSHLGGWFSDRIGSIRTQSLALFGSGVGFLLLTQLDGILAISIGVFLLAVVSEMVRPAVMTAMTECAPAALRVRSFALLRLAANLGIGIGPAVGGFLALYNYVWLFIADAITCWIAAALLPALIRNRGAAESLAGNQQEQVRSPWKDGPFLLLMIVAVVVATVIFQVMSTLPIYFREVYGFGENVIGLLLGFNGALIVAFEMVLVHWAERKRRMLMIALGGFVMCVGFGLMPLGTSIPFVMMTIAVWTVGEMLILPLMNAVVADRPGPHNRGRYMGVYMMTFSVAFMIAPAIGTATYQTFGPSTLWFGIGLLGLPVLIGTLALGRYFRRRPVDENPPVGQNDA